MDEDDFDTFLEENAWEPFEYWLAKDIKEQIVCLSDTMEEIARETRKNTLDEVRKTLKLDDNNQ